MLLSLSAVLIAGLAALPDGVTAEVRLEPPRVPFHKLARYTIVLEAPAGTVCEMPSMMGRFDGLVAKGGVEESGVEENGRVRMTETYRLDAIFPGDYAIEPVVLTIDGKEYSIPSPVLSVRELSEKELLLAERFDPALPEFAPGGERPLWRRWQFWALLAAALVAGGIVGWRLHRRDAALMGSVKPPWEAALARLDALHERGLAEKGEYDRYYVDLSSILRYYIEGRFDLHAPERTTQEFLAEMTEAGLFEAEREAFLESFLKHCDYVKFACLEPALEEMRERFEQVHRFVSETIPREESAEDAEAA